MTLKLTFDESNWLQLPAGFPTEGSETAEQWTDAVVARMRETWRGALDRATESSVRDVLAEGLAAVRPGDAVTLQYWPWLAPVAAVLHIVEGEFEAGDERPSYLLGSGALAAAPVVEVVSAQGLGDGVEVRMLTRPEGIVDDVAGLTELFVSGDRFVGLGVDAAPPLVLTVMISDLRELVETIEVVDEAGVAPWVPAVVDRDALPDPGELWPFETSAVTA